MQGGQRFNRRRSAPIRLGLEWLELRDLPSVPVAGDLGRPTTDSATPPAQSSNDTSADSGDNSTGDSDGDAASYHSTDPSKPGEYATPKSPPASPPVTPPVPDSKSHTASLDYSKVSPVGYENGQPVGSYGRINFLTPYSPPPELRPIDMGEVDPAITANAHSGIGPVAEGVRPFNPPQSREGPIGFTESDESDHSPHAVPEVGTDGPTIGPSAVPRSSDPIDDQPFIYLPELAAVIPGGWGAAAERVVNLLDEMGLVPDDGATGWERVYFWGAATAGIALGIELARRYRAPARAPDWDEQG
jgi:hypothetical protein